MSQNPYPRLFEPQVLAGQTLKNRITHASISPRFGAQQGMHPRYLHYYVNRAKGGAAMVVTDPIGIIPQHGLERLRAWDESMESDLKRLADGVRAHDSALIGQVQDTGRGRHVPGRAYQAIGASALPDDLSYSMPRAMSAVDLEAFVEHTAQSCLRMQRCGFSGIEVSAGHGHLFHQFLSPRSNRRDDAYGGDLDRRLRLLADVCSAVRHTCGAGFIIGVKLPGDDGVPGGIGEQQAGEIAQALVRQVAIDYLTYCQGSHHRSLEMHLPDDSHPRQTYTGLIARLKALTPSVPVMGLGRITDPAEAEAILVRGDADMIALGRSLIVDPAWPRKAAAGQASDIRYCVSCNTCWKTINQNRHMGCDNNPRLAQANELDETLEPAPQRRKVAVIGAGIAGLQSAVTAAQRGHRVKVWGRSGEVGGKTRLLAQLPLGESMSSIYDHQWISAQRLGVQFQLGQAATAADVLAWQPDAVVLATGADMTWPMDLPLSLQAENVLPDLRQAIADLLRTHGPQAGTAVIYDLDQTEGTYAAAEYLRDRFERVIVLSPRETIAEEVVLVARQRIHRRFFERGIEVKTWVDPVWTERFETEACLQYQSVFGGPLHDIENVAFFAYASPRQPLDDLRLPLQAAGLPVTLVGDCKIARDALAATAEGHETGMAL
jgi:2,4-dienoyl-CoA reductase-like NADH-dependent reductase (Old Yellow Enzyme family)